MMGYSNPTDGHARGFLLCALFVALEAGLKPGATPAMPGQQPRGKASSPAALSPAQQDEARKIS